MHVGVLANVYRPGIEDAISALEKWCTSRTCQVTYETTLAGYCESSAALAEASEIARAAEIVVALGGDGTMLRAARLVGRAQVPILGVNLGSLGFLTQVRPHALESALHRLTERDYVTEPRSVLSVRVPDQIEPVYAFNEVSVDRGRQTRAIELRLEIDEALVCRYVADGLIIATPTGSTAYALSAGGPVAMPGLRAVLVTPVAAHSLAQRPIVVPDDARLTVTNEEPKVEALVTVDGQASKALSYGAQCQIRKADFALQLIRFPEHNFFDLVRAKLGWGVDPRHAHRDGQVV